MQASGRTRRTVNQEQNAEIVGAEGLTINAAGENNEFLSLNDNKNVNKEEEIQQNENEIKNEPLKSENDNKNEKENKKRGANDKVRAACCCIIY